MSLPDHRQGGTCSGSVSYSHMRVEPGGNLEATMRLVKATDTSNNTEDEDNAKGGPALESSTPTAAAASEVATPAPAVAPPADSPEEEQAAGLETREKPKAAVTTVAPKQRSWTWAEVRAARAGGAAATGRGGMVGVRAAKAKRAAEATALASALTAGSEKAAAAAAAAKKKLAPKASKLPTETGEDEEEGGELAAEKATAGQEKEQEEEVALVSTPGGNVPKRAWASSNDGSSGGIDASVVPLSPAPSGLLRKHLALHPPSPSASLSEDAAAKKAPAAFTLPLTPTGLGAAVEAMEKKQRGVDEAARLSFDEDDNITEEKEPQQQQGEEVGEAVGAGVEEEQEEATGSGGEGRHASTAGLTIIAVSPRNTNKVGRFVTAAAADITSTGASSAGGVVGGACSPTPSRRGLSPRQKGALVEEGKRALLAARKEKRERDRLEALAKKVSPTAAEEEAEAARKKKAESARQMTLQERAAAAVMPWGAGVGVAAAVASPKKKTLSEVLPAVPAALSPKRAGNANKSHNKEMAMTSDDPNHYHQRWLRQQQAKKQHEIDQQQQQQDDKASGKKIGGAKAFLLNLVAPAPGGAGKAETPSPSTKTPECTPPGSSRSREVSSAGGDGGHDTTGDSSPPSSSSGGGGEGAAVSGHFPRRFRRTNSMENGNGNGNGAKGGGWRRGVMRRGGPPLLEPSCSSPMSCCSDQDQEYSHGHGHDLDEEVSPTGGGGGMAGVDGGGSDSGGGRTSPSLGIESGSGGGVVVASGGGLVMLGSGRSGGRGGKDKDKPVVVSSAAAARVAAAEGLKNGDGGRGVAGSISGGGVLPPGVSKTTAKAAGIIAAPFSAVGGALAAKRRTKGWRTVQCGVEAGGLYQ